MRPLFRLLLAVVLTPIALMSAANAQAPADGIVYVMRYIEVTADVKAKVPPLLSRLADASRKEAGALSFDILQRPDPASQFLTVEAWKDQKALDAHMTAAHTKQFDDQVGPLLLAPVDSRLCIALDAAAPSPNRAGSSAFVVVTHVDVNPPGKDAADALLKAVSAASRKDEGNLRFDVCVQNIGRFNHYQVLEVWSSQKAADAHEAAAHTKEFRAKLHPLNGALYDQRWYKPL